MQVEDIMKKTKSVKNKDINVNAEESIDNAALLMKQNKITEVAVIDDDSNIVGVITKTDIIEASDDLNEDFFLD